MPTIEFLPVAASAAANVDTQAGYAGSTYQTNGLQPGMALSVQLNKALRQGTVMAAVIANFISSVLSANVLDSGYANAAAEVAALLAQLKSAIQAYAAASNPPGVVTVAYSATPVFNCALGNFIQPCFQMQLTGNVTSSTLSNLSAGQQVTFIIQQDATGGRTFTWPVAITDGGTPDPAPNAYSQQSFIVDAGGTPRAISPMLG